MTTGIRGDRFSEGSRTGGERALEPNEIAFVTRGLSPEEIAAVTAVLTAAVAEGAASSADPTGRAPSAWARSQRPLRTLLAPGPGAWRSFSA